MAKYVGGKLGYIEITRKLKYNIYIISSALFNYSYYFIPFTNRNHDNRILLHPYCI